VNLGCRHGNTWCRTTVIINSNSNGTTKQTYNGCGCGGRESCQCVVWPVTMRLLSVCLSVCLSHTCNGAAYMWPATKSRCSNVTSLSVKKNINRIETYSKKLGADFYSTELEKIVLRQRWRKFPYLSAGRCNVARYWCKVVLCCPWFMQRDLNSSWENCILLTTLFVRNWPRF
jgi:hypothetical protein